MNGHSAPPNGVNPIEAQALEIPGSTYVEMGMHVSFRDQVLISALLLVVVIALV